MPRELSAVTAVLLAIHHATHAVLIVGGLAWLGAAATGGELEPAPGGILTSLIFVSVCWQVGRLFGLFMRSA